MGDDVEFVNDDDDDPVYVPSAAPTLDHPSVESSGGRRTELSRRRVLAPSSLQSSSRQSSLGYYGTLSVNDIAHTSPIPPAPQRATSTTTGSSHDVLAESETTTRAGTLPARPPLVPAVKTSPVPVVNATKHPRSSSSISSDTGASASDDPQGVAPVYTNGAKTKHRGFPKPARSSRIPQPKKATDDDDDNDGDDDDDDADHDHDHDHDPEEKEPAEEMSKAINVPDDEEGFFFVECIVDQRDEADGPRYLVRWQGHGPEYDTWEPASHLTECADKIAAFRRRKAQQSKRRSPAPAHPDASHTALQSGRAADPTESASMASLPSSHRDESGISGQHSSPIPVPRLSNATSALSVKQEAPAMDTPEVTVRSGRGQFSVLQRGRPRLPAFVSTTTELPRIASSDSVLTPTLGSAVGDAAEHQSTTQLARFPTTKSEPAPQPPQQQPQEAQQPQESQQQPHWPVESSDASTAPMSGSATLLSPTPMAIDPPRQTSTPANPEPSPVETAQLQSAILEPAHVVFADMTSSRSLLISTEDDSDGAFLFTELSVDEDEDALLEPPFALPVNDARQLEIVATGGDSATAFVFTDQTSEDQEQMHSTDSSALHDSGNLQYDLPVEADAQEQTSSAPDATVSEPVPMDDGIPATDSVSGIESGNLQAAAAMPSTAGSTPPVPIDTGVSTKDSASWKRNSPAISTKTTAEHDFKADPSTASAVRPAISAKTTAEVVIKTESSTASLDPSRAAKPDTPPLAMNKSSGQKPPTPAAAAQPSFWSTMFQQFSAPLASSPTVQPADALPSFRFHTPATQVPAVNGPAQPSRQDSTETFQRDSTESSSSAAAKSSNTRANADQQTSRYATRRYWHPNFHPECLGLTDKSTLEKFHNRCTSPSFRLTPGGGFICDSHHCAVCKSETLDPSIDDTSSDLTTREYRDLEPSSTPGHNQHLVACVVCGDAYHERCLEASAGLSQSRRLNVDAVVCQNCAPRWDGQLASKRLPSNRAKKFNELGLSFVESRKVLQANVLTCLAQQTRVSSHSCLLAWNKTCEQAVSATRPPSSSSSSSSTAGTSRRALSIPNASESAAVDKGFTASSSAASTSASTTSELSRLLSTSALDLPPSLQLSPSEFSAKNLPLSLGTPTSSAALSEGDIFNVVDRRLGERHRLLTDEPSSPLSRSRRLISTLGQSSNHNLPPSSQADKRHESSAVSATAVPDDAYEAWSFHSSSSSSSPKHSSAQSRRAAPTRLGKSSNANTPAGSDGEADGRTGLGPGVDGTFHRNQLYDEERGTRRVVVKSEGQIDSLATPATLAVSRAPTHQESVADSMSVPPFASAPVAPSAAAPSAAAPSAFTAALPVSVSVDPFPPMTTAAVAGGLPQPQHPAIQVSELAQVVQALSTGWRAPNPPLPAEWSTQRLIQHQQQLQFRLQQRFLQQRWQLERQNEPVPPELGSFLPPSPPPSRDSAFWRAPAGMPPTEAEPPSQEVDHKPPVSPSQENPNHAATLVVTEASSSTDTPVADMNPQTDEHDDSWNATHATSTAPAVVFTHADRQAALAPYQDILASSTDSDGNPISTEMKHAALYQVVKFAYFGRLNGLPHTVHVPAIGEFIILRSITPVIACMRSMAPGGKLTGFLRLFPTFFSINFRNAQSVTVSRDAYLLAKRTLRDDAKTAKACLAGYRVKSRVRYQLQMNASPKANKQRPSSYGVNSGHQSQSYTTGSYQQSQGPPRRAHDTSAPIATRLAAHIPVRDQPSPRVTAPPLSSHQRGRSSEAPLDRPRRTFSDGPGASDPEHSPDRDPARKQGRRS
ncbi:hypothetical protein CAOG_006813 [Capsaspora owczarzaki ATCC 30864]|uniref:Chromo domain-containing protein n=1 Tax=Capsaspora owczarzaki (strain ATCC 30864) TaxID=595528 RepID=A0A0D2WVX1_CAPO3|nr:hypothetical protein CAOG_006813 [Capsaspora owczarzaki ATCC 30864]